MKKPITFIRSPFKWLFFTFWLNYENYYAIKQVGTLNMYLHTLKGEYFEGIDGALMFHENILHHYENDQRFGDFVFVRLSDIL